MNAITWIRDGVLIDRMPENAVSFALASYSQHSPSVEELINWAFEKSGISAAEKMRLLGMENVEEAALRYTELAESADVDYFPGAVELIRELKTKGICNFITSAVRQEVLDAWAQTPQGQKVAPYLEILGDGAKGQKGEGHFAYVRNQGPSKIYAVADAPAEIASASQFADVPIGFAHVITPKRIAEAYEQMIKRVTHRPRPLPSHLELEKLKLPKAPLEQSGAKRVITGTRKSIIGNLREFFRKEKLI